VKGISSAFGGLLAFLHHSATHP